MYFLLCTLGPGPEVKSMLEWLLGSGPKVKSLATVLWRQTRGLRVPLLSQTQKKGSRSDAVQTFSERGIINQC